MYTKNGLKLRLNEEALNSVVRPLKEAGVLASILKDLEKWIDLPNAISSEVTILALFFTGSWIFMLLMGIIGFFGGAIISYSLYSNIFKRIFPLFLRNWIVADLFVLLLGCSLIVHGEILEAIVLLIIVLGNQLHLFDFLLLFLTPYRVSLHKKYGIGFTERIFMLMCNQKAEKMNMKLNWDLYDQAIQKRKIYPMGAPLDDSIVIKLSKLSDLKEAQERKVYSLPPPKKCDLCSKGLSEEQYYVDGVLKDSEGWANMCPNCFFEKGKSIDWGVGQLYMQDKKGSWLMVAGFPPKDDDSQFNSSLTEEDAYWVIRKSIEANKKKDEEQKKEHR